MPDDFAAQWAFWESKFVRLNRWRRRMWLVFVIAWGALAAMIFVVHSVSLRATTNLIVFASIFAAVLGSLIAAIALGLSESVARQQLERLDKLMPPPG